jgi:hypothetical protein
MFKLNLELLVSWSLTKIRYSKEHYILETASVSSLDKGMGDTHSVEPVRRS